MCSKAAFLNRWSAERVRLSHSLVDSLKYLCLERRCRAFTSQEHKIQFSHFNNLMTKHDRKWAGVFIFFGMFVVFLSAVVEIWVTTSVIRGEKMWVLRLR